MKKVQTELRNRQNKKEDAKEERNESLRKSMMTIKILCTQIKKMNPAKLTVQEIRNKNKSQLIDKEQERWKQSV